jgi:hypothetical protein
VLLGVLVDDDATRGMKIWTFFVVKGLLLGVFVLVSDDDIILAESVKSSESTLGLLTLLGRFFCFRAERNVLLPLLILRVGTNKEPFFGSESQAEQVVARDANEIKIASLKQFIGNGTSRR